MATFIPISTSTRPPKGHVFGARVATAQRIRKARARAARTGHGEGVMLGIGHGLEVLGSETAHLLAEIQTYTSNCVWDLSVQIIEELLTRLPDSVSATLPSQIARVTELLVHPDKIQVVLHPEDLTYLDSLQTTPALAVPSNHVRTGTAEIRVGTATITIDWRQHLKRILLANQPKTRGATC